MDQPWRVVGITVWLMLHDLLVCRARRDRAAEIFPYVCSWQVWKDALSSKAEAPYLNHEVQGSLRNLAFCPYEDVLAAGHSEGISTVRCRFQPLSCTPA